MFCDMLHEEYMKVRPKNKSLMNMKNNKSQFAHLENRIAELHNDNEKLREETTEHMSKIYKLEESLKDMTRKFNKKKSKKDEMKAK